MSLPRYGCVLDSHVVYHMSKSLIISLWIFRRTARSLSPHYVWTYWMGMTTSRIVLKITLVLVKALPHLRRLTRLLHLPIRIRDLLFVVNSLCKVPEN